MEDLSKFPIDERRPWEDDVKDDPTPIGGLELCAHEWRFLEKHNGSAWSSTVYKFYCIHCLKLKNV